MDQSKKNLVTIRQKRTKTGKLKNSLIFLNNYLQSNENH